MAPHRETYRHGRLAQVLVDAGVDLARAGGPGAVVLREATRRAGVVPNAAYRHFADRAALLRAVCDVGQSRLADAMAAAQAEVPEGGDPAGRAVERLLAAGRGYLRFARSEPGLFRTAFAGDEDVSAAGDEGKAGAGGLTPFQILGLALDDLVATGAMPGDRREDADLVAWASVHGLAMLLDEGPLRTLPVEHVDQAGEKLLDAVLAGLCYPRTHVRGAGSG